MTPQSSFMVAAPIREGHIDALKKLLAPLGMTYVVRDEAVVLTRTR